MTSISEDALDLLCGDKIGSGASRTVFVCRILPNAVVKTEDQRYWYQNIMEWEIWQAVKGTAQSKWFAECKWISPSGKVLIMERTRQPFASEYPKKLPDFFADTKRANFGMAQTTGKKPWFVCHDYGRNGIIENGVTASMKAVKWWDEERMGHE